MEAKKLKLKKAPGPDGITSKIVICIVQSCSNIVLEAFNHALKEEMFPNIWKIARLVLCILHGLGKLLEHVIMSY